MEALKVANANLVVRVHPSKSRKVTEAVLAELSSLLFKFNETFDGVVLAYDPNNWSSAARILPGVHPYLNVGLSAKLLLFSPKPDMLIEGEVIKVCQQSIHLIVLGFSSAVIMEEDLRDEFKYKFKHDKEVFISQQQKKHRIENGAVLRFAVKSFDEEILHISGSLEPAHTGNVQWLEKNLEKWSQVESSKGRSG
ncbi:hypothetical protein Leryth_014714 [Lithospermum erythrorhizon]|nr:hypothetical protein Leryth_014714 [Lithospermum erythrorhizon]